MNRGPAHSEIQTEPGPILAETLRGRIKGDVRFDALSRTIYATDASIYEITPLGVVLPKDADDVVSAVNECRKLGISVIPRGAATGLTGGTVGPGLQLDLSRYMDRIGPLDLSARTITVEPGVVLDELNAHLAPHGLQFAPDVATSSRATIGGMIANNSCGARSVVHGRTVDHVLELTLVLPDGEVVTFSQPPGPSDSDDQSTKTRAERIERGLARIRDEYFSEIQQRFPKVLRSNGGYGLDRLGPPGDRADPIKIICGSEGTLGIVVGAELKLVPTPEHTALAVLHFDHLLDALGVTPAVLRHKPAAVELVDRPILEAGRAHPTIRTQCGFLSGDPSAILIVEFHGDNATVLASAIDDLAADSDAAKSAFTVTKVLDSREQANVWSLRKAGLGLLMSKPGDDQSHAFVEDTAVDPLRLRDYIERFSAILDREGVEAGCYAHAGVGCIHVRPVINLKKADDIKRMRRIAEAVNDLVLEFGGTITGEHGDGISRSCWLERLYGPRIIAAFTEVKRLFDPDNLLNPHKIVDPYPMTEHLRYGPSLASQSVKTHLDFSLHGGMAGLAQMCSGVGQCRQRLVDGMCPSYMATNDETHTTRARANALRVALSNRGLLDGLDDPHLEEVMDLCISCKACKTECPTGVDMARLKAEYLSRRHLVHGVSRRARLIADMPHRLALAGRFPRLANLVTQSKPLRTLAERMYGLDRRVPPPRLARRTFRSWFDRHRKASRGRRPSRGTVVYFVDTWTNYFTPQVGVAAVKLLERAGFVVACPRTLCCGRPAISQGLLTDAKQLAELNVRKLARFAAAGVPIVGTEPSCTLTLVDEYPQLMRTSAARKIASQTMTLETFLQRVLADDPNALTFTSRKIPLLYHAHCHQKAIVGSADALELLHNASGGAASEINSGCCGMAGAFGHEVEHYEVSRAIGEQRLFPAIRNRGDAQIAVSGFSCRQQIQHHTGVRAIHVIEHLANALA
ncbi:MAG: FAD-binding protein [Phycisphaerales bacterium]|nr:MAG: FAD-binding protein [Phycisphaerales bacterium]